VQECTANVLHAGMQYIYSVHCCCLSIWQYSVVQPFLVLDTETTLNYSLVPLTKCANLGHLVELCKSCLLGFVHYTLDLCALAHPAEQIAALGAGGLSIAAQDGVAVSCSSGVVTGAIVLLIKHEVLLSYLLAAA
jgi:hypothetical protein